MAAEGTPLPGETEPLAETFAEGPACYRNWRAYDAKVPSTRINEAPVYSDARITGTVLEGLGPYGLINAAPAGNLDPVIMLRIDEHTDPNFSGPSVRTDDSSFSGTWHADEIAALLALLLGARLKAGAETRVSFDVGAHWTVMGDSNRPVPLFPRLPAYVVLPRVTEPKSVTIATDLLRTLPRLEPATATAVVRAARSYRDAIWIAEVDPELAWLLFVSALEVGAVHEHLENTPPVDLLRASKPDLAQKLASSGDPVLLEATAEALAPLLKATGRFVSFGMRFMPEPPTERPPEDHCLNWSRTHLKECMSTVYEYRSRALHNGVPFPPAMCRPPTNWGVPAETIHSVTRSIMGGIWVNEDLPFPLHTFEYIARGALVRWWGELAERTTPNAPSPLQSPRS